MCQCCLSSPNVISHSPMPYVIRAWWTSSAGYTGSLSPPPPPGSWWLSLRGGMPPSCRVCYLSWSGQFHRHSFTVTRSVTSWSQGRMTVASISPRTTVTSVTQPYMPHTALQIVRSDRKGFNPTKNKANMYNMQVNCGMSGSFICVIYFTF